MNVDSPERFCPSIWAPELCQEKRSHVELERIHLNERGSSSLLSLRLSPNRLRLRLRYCTQLWILQTSLSANRRPLFSQAEECLTSRRMRAPQRKCKACLELDSEIKGLLSDVGGERVLSLANFRTCSLCQIVRRRCERLNVINCDNGNQEQVPETGSRIVACLRLYTNRDVGLCNVLRIAPQSHQFEALINYLCKCMP